MLGLAHYRLGQYDDAEKSLLTCVRQAPLFSAAYRLLGQISHWIKHDPAATVFYRQQVTDSRQRIAELRHQKLTRPTAETSTSHEDRPMPELALHPESLAKVPPGDILTIVSGLPRSGTSLMMQILQAAGLPIFTDGQRPADASNQKGYYEHEKIASLMKPGDKSWLQDARGHALKIVAPLLPTVPPKLKTRVLFMERDLDEILASQTKMLTRLGKDHPTGDVSKAYLQQLRHAKTHLNAHAIPALSISFSDLVHHPDKILPTIATFLGLDDKINDMRQAIDPSLHRERH